LVLSTEAIRATLSLPQLLAPAWRGGNQGARRLKT
jgi:hypothetical protein